MYVELQCVRDQSRSRKPSAGNIPHPPPESRERQRARGQWATVEDADGGWVTYGFPSIRNASAREFPEPSPIPMASYGSSSLPT